MTDEEAAIKLTDLDNRAKSNTHRLDKLEKSNEAINRLATAVEVMAKEQSHQTQAMADIKTDVSKLDTKVEALEQKPAKRWEALVGAIIAALVALAVGYFLGS